MLWVLIRLISLGEVILMSKHYIGFYEEITKIIFQLLSNILKYALDLFCCGERRDYKIKKNALKNCCNKTITLKFGP